MPAQTTIPTNTELHPENMYDENTEAADADNTMTSLMSNEDRQTVDIVQHERH